MKPRRVIIWRATDRACVDCGRPTRYGRTDRSPDKHIRCMACDVARSLRGWRYTGCYSSVEKPVKCTQGPA